MVRDVGDWRWLVVRGVAAVVFGVLALLWPGMTLLVLVMLWGAYALVDGLVALVGAVTGRAEHRWLSAVLGLTGVVAGVVTLAWPGITGRVLLTIIGVWALVVGVVQLVSAVRLRRVISYEWALAVVGVLTVALGVLMLVRPGAGALALAWAIGWYAILAGVLLVVVALEVRRELGAAVDHLPAARPA